LKGASGSDFSGLRDFYRSNYLKIAVGYIDDTAGLAMSELSANLHLHAMKTPCITLSDKENYIYTVLLSAVFFSYRL